MEQWRDRDRWREDGRPAGAAGAASERTRRSTASPRDEGAGAGRVVAPGAADRQTRTRRPLQRALSSRQALRQAILLHEILGMPKALQRPADELPHPPEGRPPPLNGRRQDQNGKIAGRPASARREGAPPAGIEESPRLPAGPSSKAQRRAPDNSSIVESAFRVLDASANAIRRLFGRVSLGS
jgi:hypothetical protein